MTADSLRSNWIPIDLGFRLLSVALPWTLPHLQHSVMRAFTRYTGDSLYCILLHYTREFISPRDSGQIKYAGWRWESFKATEWNIEGANNLALIQPLTKCFDYCNLVSTGILTIIKIFPLLLNARNQYCIYDPQCPLYHYVPNKTVQSYSFSIPLAYCFNYK